jgi:hypothetical protein
MRGEMSHGQHGTASDPTSVQGAALQVCFLSCPQSAPAFLRAHDDASSLRANAL